jgi:hypothetical protein
MLPRLQLPIFKTVLSAFVIVTISTAVAYADSTDCSRRTISEICTQTFRADAGKANGTGDGLLDTTPLIKEVPSGYVVVNWVEVNEGDGQFISESHTRNSRVELRKQFESQSTKIDNYQQNIDAQYKDANDEIRGKLDIVRRELEDLRSSSNYLISSQTNIDYFLLQAKSKYSCTTTVFGTCYEGKGNHGKGHIDVRLVYVGDNPSPNFARVEVLLSETAKAIADSKAQATALSAKADAEAAKADTEAAKAATEAAKADALSAKADAEAAKAATESAKVEAESAKVAAESAKVAAEATKNLSDKAEAYKTAVSKASATKDAALKADSALAKASTYFDKAAIADAKANDAAARAAVAANAINSAANANSSAMKAEAEAAKAETARSAADSARAAANAANATADSAKTASEASKTAARDADSITAAAKADLDKAVAAKANTYQAVVAARNAEAARISERLSRGADLGYRDLPRAFVDVDGNGGVDYCRFIGKSPKIYIACILDKTFFGIGPGLGDIFIFGRNLNEFTSIEGIDQGNPTRPRGFKDANGDGKADYCRFVGNPPNIFESCNLATSSGFDKNQYTLNLK